MGSQGAAKGTSMKMPGRWKNPSDFLLDFMRSCQDLAFFHQDPGWDPKGQLKGQNGKCLAGGKTLTTFDWIL